MTRGHRRQPRAASRALGDVPVVGALFRKGGQASSKRELVILIKPTVVKIDTDWADDIAATQPAHPEHARPAAATTS